MPVSKTLDCHPAFVRTNNFWQLGSLCCIPGDGRTHRHSKTSPSMLHSAITMPAEGVDQNIHQSSAHWTDFVLAVMTGTALQQSEIRCSGHIRTLPFCSDGCEHEIVNCGAVARCYGL